jgi:hypothetical protein
MLSDSAVTNEPSARAPIATSSMRRLPNMSPSRPPGSSGPRNSLQREAG